MARTILMVFTLAIVLSACSKNRENEYIKIYTDTLDTLYKYSLVLEQIKKSDNVSESSRSLLINYHSNIVSLNKKAITYGDEFERNVEIRKKLRDILVKITLVQTHIVQLQKQILTIPGVTELFRELNSRGGE